MASAAFELQTAIYAALLADAGVTAALGGAFVYDAVPRAAAYPYVTFGQTAANDWSTGTEDGEEHTVTLHVWSRAAGRRETQSIIAAVRTGLDNADLALPGHHLVNLQHEFSEARRDVEGEAYRGLVRFRAVTEPAA